MLNITALKTTGKQVKHNGRFSANLWYISYTRYQTCI